MINLHHTFLRKVFIGFQPPPLSTSPPPLSSAFISSYYNFALQQDSILFDLLQANIITLLWLKRRRKCRQDLENSSFCVCHQLHCHSTNKCQALLTKNQQIIDFGIIQVTGDNEWHLCHHYFK